MRTGLPVLLVLAGCVFASTHAMAAEKSSSLALDPARGRLLVANADSNSVSVVDVGDSTLVGEFPVGRNPQALFLDSGGKRLLVTNFDEDTLSVVDVPNAEVQACIPLGDEPFGIVADARHVFVSNSGAASVLVKDRTTLRTVAEIATAAEPRGMALADATARLYVTHFLSGKVSVIDTETLELVGVIDMGSGAMLSQNLVLDPASSLAYAPQTLANTANASLQFDTTVFPVVSVIDTTQLVNRRAERIAVDIADRPVSIPLDAALSGDGLLYLVNAGSNDLSIVNLATNKAVAHLATGDNPRAIVLDEDTQRAYVSNALAGTVSVVDTALRRVVGEITVTSLPLAPQILEGKRLFNSADDTTLARDQWIACATCHFDGRHDGRTWLFPDGPRNTPSLLGVHATLPVHWSGDLDELHDVESTVRTIQAGTGLATGDTHCDPACDKAPANAGRSATLDAMAAYMMTLDLPVSPLQSQPLGLSAAAARGQQLFTSATTACSSCHVPPLYTDNLMHEVGTGVSGIEKKGNRFNTPALLGLDRTAPYLHDGSMASLMHLLAAARDGRHGDTSALSDAQLVDIEQFLLELPAPGGVAVPETLCGLSRQASVELLSAASSTGPLTRGDHLVLSARADAATAVDLYLGVIFPDGSFKSLQENGRFGAFGQVGRALQLPTAPADATFTLLDYAFTDPLPAGNYTLVLISTLSQADFTQRQHWVDVDSVEITVAPY